jgi:flagellar biosynthesis GTPase FlhF
LSLQEHHRELERREQEEKEREKEARRFQERKNRDAFTELLHEHKAEGLLTIRMRWKEYASAVKVTPPSPQSPTFKKCNINLILHDFCLRYILFDSVSLRRTRHTKCCSKGLTMPNML